MQAKRHNYLPGLSLVETDYVVREVYGYGGPEGRLSSRETAVSDQRSNGIGSQLFRQEFTYDPLGNLSSQLYPDCQHASCAETDPARAVTYGYNQGTLVSVNGFAPSISYHPNGALEKVVHSNGWEDVLELDEGDWMQRPKNLRTGPAGSTAWETGTFLYDGSGNIRSIGADQFTYDKVSRLVGAVMHLDGVATSESYTYDRFGNITSIKTNDVDRPYTYDLQTNRTLDANFQYDAAGNVTEAPGSPIIAYDAFGMVTQATGTGKHDLYLYTPDDERLATIDRLSSPERVRWTLRGLEMKVLRTYQSKLTERDGFAAWSWSQDHVYRGSSLLASVKPSISGPETVEHFHLDHLGTPRLKTNSATPASIVAEHKYLPYGEELTNPLLDNEVMQFTSHERDRDVSGNGNDVDYVHARYYTGRTGRFLSFDPVGGTSELPQSWNRYAYTANNPLNYIDPTGMARVCTGEGDSETCVFVDGNGDGGTSDDDLAEDQIRDLSKAYGAFIAANDGADLGDKGTKVSGGSEADRSLIRAASQFVGASLENGWQNTEIILTNLGAGEAGRLDWLRNARYPNEIFLLLINPGEASHGSNPSSVARTLTHESLHRDRMDVRAHNRDHREIDDQAKAYIQKWGLAGMGCPAFGGRTWFGFGPQFYSGCQ